MGKKKRDEARFGRRLLAVPLGRLLAPSNLKPLYFLARSTMADTEAKTKKTAAPASAPEAPKLKLKMFIAPLLLLGSKKMGIDYSDPAILFKVRAGFACAMALCISACALMYLLVHRRKKKLTEDKVQVTSKDPMDGGKEKIESLTLFEHDLREVQKAFTNQVFGFGIVVAMHVYMKVNPPLLLQTVMLPMNLFDMPVVQVHLLGKKPVGKLARPWKPEEKTNPFGEMAKAFGGGDKDAGAETAKIASAAAKKEGKKKK
jgi:hypothetical protein